MRANLYLGWFGFLKNTMEKFIFLEHTADAKFRAFGGNMEEAFSNAALAMFSIICSTAKVKAAEIKEFSVKGNDLKALLYNFLEELLFLFDSERFILHKVEKISIRAEDKTYFLNAKVAGDSEKEGYGIHGDIKAVTYNQMEIHEGKGKVILQVVVDI